MNLLLVQLNSIFPFHLEVAGFLARVCVSMALAISIGIAAPASGGKRRGTAAAEAVALGEAELLLRRNAELERENEIEQRAEDMPASSQHPSLEPAYNFPSANVHSNSFSFGNVAAALNSRMGQTDQTRIVGISNALSNPLRQTFHSNHLVQCSGYGPINSLPNGNGGRNNHSPQNQDFMHCNSYEPSMDMNHDAP